MIYIKGAPEKLWTLCKYILINGANVPINHVWNQKFDDVNLQLAKLGERVLGFAQLRLPAEQFPKNFAFDVTDSTKYNFPLKDMTFVGLISLIDPPKDTVPWAVKKCKTANIKVVMVTGDQPATAAAIAK